MSSALNVELSKIYEISEKSNSLTHRQTSRVLFSMSRDIDQPACTIAMLESLFHELDALKDDAYEALSDDDRSRITYQSLALREAIFQLKNYFKLNAEEAI